MPGWELKFTEFPWRAADGRDCFLDAVATNGRIVLPVECKKSSQESLTFLRPLGLQNTGRVSEFRCVHYYSSTGNNWYKQLDLAPESYQSELCVASREKRRIIEPEVRSLVQAADEVARHIQHQRQPLFEYAVDRGLVIVPVYVTNSPLYSVRYRPESISLATGELALDDVEPEEVNVLRFRKAFGTAESLLDAERSVFVVRTESLADFVRELRVGRDTTPVPRTQLR